MRQAHVPIDYTVLRHPQRQRGRLIHGPDARTAGAEDRFDQPPVAQQPLAPPKPGETVRPPKPGEPPTRPPAPPQTPPAPRPPPVPPKKPPTEPITPT